ncbi:MAG: CBS domain-containing protein [Longimicrobiales bacterium]|nr:CBS domain-containing protein [Longimicrobiales bacterium]
MNVRELLRKKSKGVVTVESTATLARAAELMMDHAIGGLPVIELPGSALVGFVSERDIVDAVDRRSQEVLTESVQDLPVTTVMRRPAPTCRGAESIRDVMARMTRGRLRHLVVLDDEDRIAGVISVGDLVKDRLEELETEAGVLRDYVAGQRAKK